MNETVILGAGYTGLTAALSSRIWPRATSTT
ncbi:thioredoxin reductase [Kitasatospora sp. MAP12-15]|nr:thioredoxin reductase [Kitasatospora sp. MAP12-44]